MKKIFTVLLAILFVGLFIPTESNAQIKITTKKEKLSDFERKTTKIVLRGNEFTDDALKQNATSTWTLSPFEFCSQEEFESLKTSDNYYFLMIVKGQNKKEVEAGLDFITLVKGGSAAKDGISEMEEVITLPYASSKWPSGRESIYLPAMLDIIQEFTRNAMSTDLKGYSGPSYYNVNLPKAKNKEIYFSEDDLSAEVSESAIKDTFRKGMFVEDEDSVDERFADGEPGVVIAYSIMPSEASVGSVCYKLLIDANNHDLLYFRKHKITAKAGPGFLLEDIKKIATGRSK
ncbi:MAG: hypothetical protein MJZ16_04880 [Bacteroidales bacterium]|nr:hypothetical protein [Bacteroidales bacterium]